MECPRCHAENPEDSSTCLKCGLPFTKPEELSRTKTTKMPLSLEDRGKLVAGRYQVMERLGAGGMAEVYRVIDQETREEVALKLLRIDTVRDERAIERFRNELKTVHQLNHRNICRMYHLGREGETFFIVMEYVPGEDLKNFIRRSGQLSVGKAIFLARQVCDGLGEAHARGIVHRDLKPHNIMIDPEGNAEIMDFGIARSFQDEGLTGAGYAVGTPAYMAPEQAEGKDVDERTDIYSLGVVLYEMVTGQPPFEGDTQFSVAYKHIHLEPEAPSALNRLIPEEMSRVILKCLQKDKCDRFQNAGELCAALGDIASQITRSGKKHGPVTTQRERRKKRRKILSIAASSVIALSVLIFGYIKWREPRGSTQQETPTAPAQWINSIAVLPFEDLSLDRSLENICESMTANITSKLGSTGVLKIPSRHSTQRFSGQTLSPQEIGKELGVNNILDTSLHIQDDRILVIVNLVRTLDGAVSWSGRYLETKKNILILEDDISNDVALELGLKLTAENQQKLKRRDPREVEDYDVFRWGRHYEYMYGEYSEEEDFQNALKHLKEYSEVHPDYALVYCSLGNIHEHRFVEKNDPNDEILMRLYYENAHRLDPDLEETNLGMGWSHFYLRDYDRSYEYFKRAVELGPNNSEVNWNVGSFFRSIGLDERATKYYEKALVSDPLNASIHRLCAASYMYIGQYENGLGSIDRAIDLDRKNVEYLTFSARLLLLHGRLEEAEGRITEAKKLQPETAENKSLIMPLEALISALQKDREKALSQLNESGVLDVTRGSAYDLPVSSVYSVLGMKTEAVRTLEEGIGKSSATSS